MEPRNPTAQELSAGVQASEGPAPLGTEARMKAWLELRQLQHDLPGMVTTEPQDFAGIQATLRRIEELSATAGVADNLEIKPENPATWPPALQARREQALAEDRIIFEDEHDKNLDRLKRDILGTAILGRLGERYLFMESALHYLARSLPADSIESCLAYKLYDEIYFLLLDAAGEALELVPKLQELMPCETSGDLLAALESDGTDA